MRTIGSLLSDIIHIFQIPITIYGVTFDYWQVYCFSFVGGLLAWVLSEWFLGD